MKGIQATAEFIEGLGAECYIYGQGVQKEESPTSPSSKFIDLRMGRNSWQMFPGQDISLSLL